MSAGAPEGDPGPSGGLASRGGREWRDRDVALSGGLVLRVREWGGEGPPLLLVHGFLGSRASWGGLPGRLGPVHAVAVDLPGHGDSGGGDAPDQVTVPAVARRLAELQERVFGGPAAWLGYSMGGRIALAAAAEGLPVRCLLLESAGPGLATGAERAARRRADHERAERLEARGMESFVDEWLRLPLFQGLAALPPEERGAARAVRAAQDPARMAAWLRGGGTGSQRDYRPDLPTVEPPVFLIAGARDDKYVQLGREMAAALPRAELTVVDGVGHSVHLEAPAAWLRWVRSALR